MYLAPLNYNRFFKKVFGKKRIAKAFLEDFLNIKIKRIEILNDKNFITDKSLPVEFDYRCELDNGEQIIIEMQQWYKTDIIKRFYLYHSLSTSLQLEKLEEKVISIDVETGSIIKDKLYNDLKPSITLIWMVDDNLGFKEEDFIVFKMGVEELDDFIKDDKLWNDPIENILKERKRILELKNNNTKDLGFLSKNKLIFIFQKNIVKNLKNKKNKNSGEYPKWFDFAKKTKSKKNKKSDFTEYKNDKLFIDIMNMLLKDRLTQDEIKYITKEEELKEAYIKYTSVILEAKKEAQEEKRKAQEEKRKADEFQKKLEEERKKTKEQMKEAVLDLFKMGLTKEQIANSLKLSIKEIEKIIKN